MSKQLWYLRKNAHDSKRYAKKVRNICLVKHFFFVFSVHLDILRSLRSVCSTETNDIAVYTSKERGFFVLAASGSFMRTIKSTV